MLWSFGQQIGNQMVSFSISILLARLLLPEDFGIIGLTYVFLTFGNLLIDAGMSHSLIRTQHPTAIDYATVFFSNLGIAFLLYLVLFISAPSVALFYQQPLLTPIIRVNSLSFIVIACSTVQNAILLHQLKFKKLLLLSLPSNCIGGLVGVCMAYNGFGVWSLVATSLVTLSITSALLWLQSEWKPQLIFDFSVFKKHFFYGYKLTLTNFLNASFTNAYMVILGKFYTPQQVGYYTRADSMRNISVYTVLNAVNRVSFPLIASVHDDQKVFHPLYNRLLQTVFYSITPFLMVLAVLAQPLFVFLFTEKWVFAVPYFQILILSSVFFTLNSVNTSVLSSIGKSNVVLQIESIKIIFALLVITTALNFDLSVLLWTQVLLSLLDFFIIGRFMKKHLSIPLAQPLYFILKVLVLNASCAIGLYFLNRYFETLQMLLFLRLVLGGLFFFALYIGLSYVLRFTVLTTLLKAPTPNKCS